MKKKKRTICRRRSEEGHLFFDFQQEEGMRRKKMKTGVKLSFYAWVCQLTEPRQQFSDVAVINWVKGRNFK
jgi:hypothetical protein